MNKMLFKRTQICKKIWSQQVIEYDPIWPKSVPLAINVLIISNMELIVSKSLFILKINFLKKAKMDFS